MLTSTDYFKAQQNGIKPATFRMRIKRGWDKETAMTEPVNEVSKWRKIALENGIKRSTFDDRVYMQGLPVQIAATKPVSSYPAEILELAESNGISKAMFYDRIRWKMTPERAATQPVRKQRKWRVTNE